MNNLNSSFLKLLIRDNLDKSWFELNDLYTILEKNNERIEPEKLKAYIRKLRKDNFIYEFLNGVYTFNVKKEYYPLTSDFYLKVTNRIIRNFPALKFSIWETNWLSQYINMVSFKNYLIVEAEKYATLPLFEYLRQEFQNKVYLKPDRDIISNYGTYFNEIIIVKNGISQSPVKNAKQHTNDKKYNIPRLEKILIDLFNDDDIFFYYRGNELKEIYSSILENYNINYSTLFTYAKRRGKFNSFKDYLNQIFDEINFSNDLRRLIFDRLDK